MQGALWIVALLLASLAHADATSSGEVQASPSPRHLRAELSLGSNLLRFSGFTGGEVHQAHLRATADLTYVPRKHFGAGISVSRDLLTLSRNERIYEPAILGLDVVPYAHAQFELPSTPIRAEFQSGIRWTELNSSEGAGYSNVMLAFIQPRLSFTFSSGETLRARMLFGRLLGTEGKLFGAGLDFFLSSLDQSGFKVGLEYSATQLKLRQYAEVDPYAYEDSRGMLSIGYCL